MNAIAALATLKVWATYLPPVELGLMALIIAAASILAGVVVDPLVRAMLVRYAVHVHGGREREFRAVGGGVVAGYAGMCISAIVVVGMAVSFFLDLHWSTPLLIAGLFAVDAKRYFEQMLLAAARRQREVAMLSVGDVWLRFAFVWLFLFVFGASAHVAVAGNLLGAAIAFALLRMMLGLGGHPSANSVVDDIREQIRGEILRIAWPIVPANVLANVTEMASRYIIAATIGLHQAGIFVASYGLVKRPFGMLSDIGYSAMMPACSEAIAKNKFDEATQAQWLWIGSITLLSVSGAAFLYVFREPIVAILLSAKYASAVDYLFGIAIAVAVCNINNVLNGLLMTRGDSKSVLTGNVVAAVVTTGMTIAFSPLFGLDGVVWAMAMGYTLQFLVLMVMLRTASGRQPPSGEVRSPS